MARLLWNLHHLHCCVEKHGCMKRNQQDTGANYWRSNPSRRSASVGLSLPLLLTFFWLWTAPMLLLVDNFCSLLQTLSPQGRTSFSSPLLCCSRMSMDPSPSPSPLGPTLVIHHPSAPGNPTHKFSLLKAMDMLWGIMWPNGCILLLFQ